MSKHTRLHTSTRPEAQWFGGIHFPAVRQRPRMFILENVRNLQVRGLPDVLHALRRCGYKVACMLQTPLDFGVPQHRQRLYLLGFRNDVLRQDVTDDDLQHFLDGFYVRLSRVIASAALMISCALRTIPSSLQLERRHCVR